MKKNWRNYLYLITIIFFSLGFINIIFGWLGLACMTLPFILLVRDRKKTWCQSYCPRANLFTKLFKGRSITGKPAPAFITKGNTKWFVLVYFIFNLFVLTVSTIMVYIGRIKAMGKLRFMMAFQLPWDIPQLLNIGYFPDWAVHLSFRMYSMMLTTTIIGIILGWVYVPRTWCTICPVNTISDLGLKKIKKDF